MARAVCTMIFTAALQRDHEVKKRFKEVHRSRTFHLNGLSDFRLGQRKKQ